MYMLPVHTCHRIFILKPHHLNIEYIDNVKEFYVNKSLPYNQKKFQPILCIFLGIFSLTTRLKPVHWFDKRRAVNTLIFGGDEKENKFQKFHFNFVNRSEKIDLFWIEIEWLNRTSDIIFEVKVFCPPIDINMDAEEFRKFGYAAIDFVADYLENIRDRFVWKFEWHEKTYEKKTN